MEEFIGNNYNIPQLDLSERPENTPEKYAYLYEQTVVDDSERARLYRSPGFRAA